MWEQPLLLCVAWSCAFKTVPISTTITVRDQALRFFFFSFHVAKYHTSFRDANIWCHLLYRPTSPQPRPLVFKNLRPFPFSELTFFAFVRKQKSVVWGTPCPPHPTRLVIATGQKFLKICSETINIGTPVMRLLWSIPGLNFSPENANLSHSSICRVRKQSCL